ncbi:hypothetical protein LJB99_02370 [Deltaproteobacteria bacterium OttesenSCG-928-K17]|nr:hypothetical protein [Deltaproteobacteria bacterium OttesenSCG-928-K17]
MPHPPIMVPEVGRGREREAARTLEGLSRLQNSLAALPRKGRPDVLLVLSPHQPYAPGALFLNSASVLAGGLERFGAASVRFSLNTSPLVAELGAYLEKAGLPCFISPVENLTPDHGTSVPLYFLSRVFENMPELIVASPIGLSPNQALEFGRALKGFSPAGFSLALLASGDLSHRLLPEAPAGFDPEGRAFDEALIESLESGEAREMLSNWPPERLNKAGECGFRSALALLGLAGGPVEVLSYEGPFGVGYANALWINEKVAL